MNEQQVPFRMTARTGALRRTLSEVLPSVDTFTVTLFFLLFSGPPKFRLREADASLYQELDLVLIIQIAVWLVAGAWVARQLWLSHNSRRPALRFLTGHKLAVALILALAIGVSTSLAIPLTAFKVYQVAVSFLFCLMFMEWHGIDKFFELLLYGHLAFCTVIAACAVFVPSYVFAESETGAMRLEGRLIAEASAVAAFALMFLFGRKRIPGFWFWTALSGSVLLASLSRSAWAGVAIFFVIAVLRRPELPHLRTIYAACATGLALLLVFGTSYLNSYRDPETVYTLSDRLGLWAYLTTSVLSRSPWTGLGYVAGTRSLGTEYNPGLGSGHSLYFEVFVGSGLIGLIVFLLLLSAVAWSAFRVLKYSRQATEFTVAAMFLVLLVMASIGGELESTPSAFTFWGLLCAVPLLADSVPILKSRQHAAVAN